MDSVLRRWTSAAAGNLCPVQHPVSSRPAAARRREGRRALHPLRQAAFRALSALNCPADCQSRCLVSRTPDADQFGGGASISPRSPESLKEVWSDAGERGLTTEDFEGPRYVRLKRIQQLADERRLD